MELDDRVVLKDLLYVDAEVSSDEPNPNSNPNPNPNPNWMRRCLLMRKRAKRNKSLEVAAMMRTGPHPRPARTPKVVETLRLARRRRGSKRMFLDLQTCSCLRGTPSNRWTACSSKWVWNASRSSGNLRRRRIAVGLLLLE